jgi:hypothetical protein
MSVAIYGGYIMNNVSKGLFKWIMILALALSLATVAVAEEIKRHWYVKQGKERPLCEALVKIANANPHMRRAPNIPWQQVLAIKGVSEPKWKELDPRQYEIFFLKARKSMEAEYPGSNHATIFSNWFLALKDQRGIDRKKKLTDEDALKIYRAFVKRGGKMKVYSPTVPDGLRQRDFVQYESPDKEFADWEGYSLITAPGLTDVIDTGFLTSGVGWGRRILTYEDRVYSFHGHGRGFGEYRVSLVVGDMEMDEQSPYAVDAYYCEIDSKIIEGSKKTWK